MRSEVQKKITLRHQEVNCRVRRSSRARCLRLTICCGESFAVTLPPSFPWEKALYFISKKSGWILEKLAIMKKRRENSLLSKGSRREYEKLKNDALELVLNRVAFFKSFYKCEVGKIIIRNQKTRWGSCSKKGNLNFNYRIIFLEKPLQDYLIVHELCHRIEFNHSKKFWALIGRTIPNCRKTARKLKKY